MKEDIEHGDGDKAFEQVDDAGEVVRNTWQDCQDGCPGTSRKTHKQ